MLTVRLNRNQENAVQVLAKSRGESKSEFVRGLIDEAVKTVTDSGGVFADIRKCSQKVHIGKALDIRAMIADGRR